MRGLTDKQMNVLAFIHERTVDSGIPPTLREIGNHFCIRSTNGVNDHLRALERKGYIERLGGKSRGLLLTETAKRVVAMDPYVETARLMGLYGAEFCRDLADALRAASSMAGEGEVS